MFTFLTLTRRTFAGLWRSHGDPAPTQELNLRWGLRRPDLTDHPAVGSRVSGSPLPHGCRASSRPTTGPLPRDLSVAATSCPLGRSAHRVTVAIAGSVAGGLSAAQTNLSRHPTTHPRRPPRHGSQLLRQEVVPVDDRHVPDHRLLARHAHGWPLRSPLARRARGRRHHLSAQAVPAGIKSSRFRAAASSARSDDNSENER